MTQPVDNTLRRPIHDPFADPPPTPAGPPPTPAAARELDVGALPTPDRPITSFLRNAPRTPPAISAAASAAPTATAAQQVLDRTMAAYSGPYTVDGEQVRAPCQFRMRNGYNDVAAGVRTARPDRPYEASQIDHSAETRAIAAKVGANAAGLLGGYPSASDVVKVTQALIDAGHLPPGTPEDAASRIKRMQWQWGIGVDCTDYAVPAAARAAGVRVDVTPGVDYFGANLGKSPDVVRVSVGDAKTGDVFCLASPERGEAGHRAVVYSRVLCDPSRAADLASTYGAKAARFLGASGGRVQVFEVDSSFGATEDGLPTGGVRRDVWLYNEGLGKWAQIQPNPFDPTGGRRFAQSTTDGPYCENLQGIYRFQAKVPR